MSLVNLSVAVDGIISIKTHLKGAFGLSGILDLAFLFIEEIWHDVQKGSGYILSSTSYQTLSVPPANHDLLDLCPNLWCSNSKAIFFLAGNLFFFDISLILPRNACFLCALCGNVTAFFFSATNYNVKNPLWKRQFCPAFINIMIENNLSHKSGAKITLCNVAMKDFPLSSHICICTWPFGFTLTWCPYAT